MEGVLWRLKLPKSDFDSELFHSLTNADMSFLANVSFYHTYAAPLSLNIRHSVPICHVMEIYLLYTRILRDVMPIAIRRGYKNQFENGCQLRIEFLPGTDNTLKLSPCKNRYTFDLIVRRYNGSKIRHFTFTFWLIGHL